jgi:glycine/D-amino acid oxidase-like deaminating enzyme
MNSPTGVAAINAAKTHCYKGHPFDEANTLMKTTRGRIHRACYACAKETWTRRNAEQLERVLPQRLVDKFFARIEPPISFYHCWIWAKTRDKCGYGRASTGRVMVGQRKRSVLAHRWAYELAIGPIPEGLEIDHLCNVRSCVNPLHLEPVTHRENVRRGHGAEASRSPACSGLEWR